jgi:hypothetical protein
MSRASKISTIQEHTERCIQNSGWTEEQLREIASSKRLRGYDPCCEELARLFLREEGMDTDAQVADLAQGIQDTIETFIEARKGRSNAGH